MNLSRLIVSRGDTLVVEASDIKAYAKEYYRSFQKANRATWNGRQIKNVFQTAIALAEFDNRTRNTGEQVESRVRQPVVLRRSHFEVVAKAAESFDNYLGRIHGPDADRARRAGERAGGMVGEDELGGRRRPSAFELFSSTRKVAKKRDDSSESSDSSSSEDQDPKERKKSKGKKANKEKKRVKNSESSSSEDDEEEEGMKERMKEKEKRAKKEATRLKEAQKEKEKARRDISDETSSEE